MKFLSKNISLVIVAGALLFLSCSKSSLHVERLRCEYVKNPIGMNVARPRLSWELSSSQNAARQTAYRILVSDSREKLRLNKGDFWDSGKVLSGRTSQIVYAGRPLPARQRVFWKVRVWDQKDRPSEWSPIAFWEMGLSSSDWQAKWIGKHLGKIRHPQKKNPAFYFRKVFRLSQQPKTARLYISGLGYEVGFLNGKKISDHVLSPNHTNYSSRNDRAFPEKRVGNMASRVLYETFDVTPLLKPGENVLTVILGNGWFFQNEREEDLPFSYGTPRLLAQLEIRDAQGKTQVVATDASWKVNTGPIVHNGIYSGEIYDARRERPGWKQPGFDDSHWEPAILVSAPDGKLLGQISPPDRVTRTLRPESLRKIDRKTYRYDFGQMLSGWARLHVSGQKGDSLDLRFVEDSGTTYGQRDLYICGGRSPETWEPRFTWHGFRYVDVRNAPFPMKLENLEARVVNTDVDSSGEFVCSNHLFNRILKNYRWTQLGNIHGGVPSDCPHRERRGYTGDGQISAPAALWNFDMAAFYTKWANDIDDAQNKKTGYVPYTAPYQSGGGGVAWGSAMVLIPWDVYLFYGDQRILKTHYPAIKMFLNYLTRQRDAAGLIREPDLGEWVPPAPTEIPASLVSTAYFYHDLRLAARMAKFLGKSEDAAEFEQLAKTTRRAFNKAYFHPAKNSYSIGRQGANVFALGFGLVPDSLQKAVFGTLVQHLRETGYHFDTGMMGTPLLLEVLTRFSRPDLAYALMNQKDFPSFGNEIEHGATTLWETWDGAASHSHPMFGGVCAWFYQALAGLRPDPEAPGFSHVLVAPQPVRNLTFVRVSYHSIHGPIQSAWSLKNGDLTLSLTLPANTSATVSVPAKSGDAVRVKGKPVRATGFSGKTATFQVGSGRFVFVSKGAEKILPATFPTAPDISPGDTIVTKGDSVRVAIHSDLSGGIIRFTTNGKEPNSTAARYTGPFFLKKSAEIRARVFQAGFPPGFVSKRMVSFVDPRVNGVRFAYFEGKWKKLPDFRKLTPAKEGTIQQIGLEDIHPRVNQFGLVLRSKIEIPKAGLYTFYLTSNDGSDLFIDGKRVVSNDGLHGSLEKSGRIRLTRGRHDLRITYFQAGGSMDLKLSLTGPDGVRRKVPPDWLFKN